MDFRRSDLPYRRHTHAVSSKKWWPQSKVVEIILPEPEYSLPEAFPIKASDHPLSEHEGSDLRLLRLCLAELRTFTA
jgi:hypothetical protein